MLERLCGIHIPCPSARSSAIVVDEDVRVVERVNVLRASGRHRHYSGMTFEKDVVGAVAHHRRRFQIEACAYLDRVRKCGEGSKNGSIGPYYRCRPPFIRCKSIWGRNHELVAPPDHGAFVGMVTLFSSGTLSLK
jgi:hypothetical protein